MPVEKPENDPMDINEAISGIDNAVARIENISKAFLDKIEEILSLQVTSDYIEGPTSGDGFLDHSIGCGSPPSDGYNAYVSQWEVQSGVGVPIEGDIVVRVRPGSRYTNVATLGRCTRVNVEGYCINTSGETWYRIAQGWVSAQVTDVDDDKIATIRQIDCDPTAIPASAGVPIYVGSGWLAELQSHYNTELRRINADRQSSGLEPFKINPIALPSHIAGLEGFGSIRIYFDESTGYYWFEADEPPLGTSYPDYLEALERNQAAVVLAYALYFTSNWWAELDPDGKTIQVEGRHPLSEPIHDWNNPCVTGAISICQASGLFDPSLPYGQSTYRLYEDVLGRAEPTLRTPYLDVEDMEFDPSTGLPWYDRDGDSKPDPLLPDEIEAWENIQQGTLIFVVVENDAIPTLQPYTELPHQRWTHVVTVIGWSESRDRWHDSDSVMVYRDREAAMAAGIANPVPYIADRGVSGAGHDFRIRAFNDLQRDGRIDGDWGDFYQFEYNNILYPVTSLAFYNLE